MSKSRDHNLVNEETDHDRHIALNEAGLNFDQVKVDLKTHRTEEGRDYALINAKGRWVDVADQGSTAYALWIGGATPPQGLFM